MTAIAVATGLWISSCNKGVIVRQPPPRTKKGPISLVYIEVNNNNLLNTGCYTLTKGGQPFFDIAVIFAANINYDTTQKKAVLYNNPNVNQVLTGYRTYVKPLQDLGIKVTLSILGNHEGAGIANFTSRAAARDFATQLTQAVNEYHLDGIDFDDEYADYGEDNGLPNANDSSFILLLSELRKQMPDKLITFYDIGPASYYTSYDGQEMGSLLNYAYNPYYGIFNPPSIPGMPNSQQGAAAIDFGSTDSATATSLASQTVAGGYGVIVWYDLSQTDESAYLAGSSNILYGSGVTVPTGCPQPWVSPTGE